MHRGSRGEAPSWRIRWLNMVKCQRLGKAFLASFFIGAFCPSALLMAFGFHSEV